MPWVQPLMLWVQFLAARWVCADIGWFDWAGMLTVQWRKARPRDGPWRRRLNTVPRAYAQVDLSKATNVLDRWINASSRNLARYVHQVRAAGAGAALLHKPLRCLGLRLRAGVHCCPPIG